MATHRPYYKQAFSLLDTLAIPLSCTIRTFKWCFVILYLLLPLEKIEETNKNGRWKIMWEYNSERHCNLYIIFIYEYYYINQWEFLAKYWNYLRVFFEVVEVKCKVKVIRCSAAIAIQYQHILRLLKKWISQYILIFKWSSFGLSLRRALACPKISNLRNPYGIKHFCSHLENELLKNQKTLKIWPHLGVPICDQSSSI